MATGTGNRTQGNGNVASAGYRNARQTDLNELRKILVTLNMIAQGKYGKASNYLTDTIDLVETMCEELEGILGGL